MYTGCYGCATRHAAGASAERERWSGVSAHEQARSRAIAWSRATAREHLGEAGRADAPQQRLHQAAVDGGRPLAPAPARARAHRRGSGLHASQRGGPGQRQDGSRARRAWAPSCLPCELLDCPMVQE